MGSLVEVTWLVQLKCDEDQHTELIINLCALIYSKGNRRHLEQTLRFSKRFITNGRSSLSERLAARGGPMRILLLRCCSAWGSSPARSPWAAWWRWAGGASSGWILPGCRALAAPGLRQGHHCLCFSLSRHKTQALVTWQRPPRNTYCLCPESSAGAAWRVDPQQLPSLSDW